MHTYRIRICLALFLASVTTAHAQALRQGQPAPPDITASLASQSAITIGQATVRPVPTSLTANDTTLRPQSAYAKRETTFVVRASDNLVGISTNDLVVLHPDTSAVMQAATQATTSKAYPEMQLVVLHFADFAQIVPAKEALAKRFPDAKFDLPVRYGKLRLR